METGEGEGMSTKKFRAWVGFCDDKPFMGYAADTRRDGIPFDATIIFKSRTEARYRFHDVRRCEITIKPVRRRSKRP